MSSQSLSRETLDLHPASKRTLTSDFTALLPSGVTLASDATATQKKGPGQLAITGVAINTGGAVTVTAGSLSTVIATGKAIQFSVDARRVTPGLYEIETSAVASDGQIIARTERLRVMA